jgi:hypothetical protein
MEQDRIRRAWGPEQWPFGAGQHCGTNLAAERIDMAAARLLIEDLPGWGAGAKRYVVRCERTTSYAAVLPTPTETISHAEMVTVALVKHAHVCGRCDLSLLWEQADLKLRAEIALAMCSPNLRRLPERRN